MEFPAVLSKKKPAVVLKSLSVIVLVAAVGASPGNCPKISSDVEFIVMLDESAVGEPLEKTRPPPSFTVIVDPLALALLL